MRRLISRLLSLWLVFTSMGAVAQATIPGLESGGRRWVVLLMEDHAGMRELVWDSAFTDQRATGPFSADHRYALLSKGSLGFVDLGCWDQAWPASFQAGAVIAPATWTKDHSGVVVSAGGRQTWLPFIADYDGKSVPEATYRGAYLNWLLLNRPTTPAIPRETRWQRLQRGALAVVTDLLTRSGGAPEFRVVGIGTSGRLLIPPGEGLPAGKNAVVHMEPADSGSMDQALQRALVTAQSLKSLGDCQTGIVLAVGDGQTLSGSCHGAEAYEPSSAYGSMLQTVKAIQATGQAETWAWSLDGTRVWARDFASLGGGQVFSGDAVAALDAAMRGWVSAGGQALQLSLSFDQLPLTRVVQVTLSIQANHSLVSATLNGQPITTTGTLTKVPLTLKEGLNTFTVAASDLCGGQAQASASITLDTVPPRITLNPAPASLTNQTALTLKGQVDDPSAKLTMNGQPLPTDPLGAFSVLVQLQEGQNSFAFSATDAAGNGGRLDVSVTRDTTAPIVIFTAPAEGLLTNSATLQIAGTVSDSAATLNVNGQAVPLVPQATGATFSLSLSPAEGPLTLLAEATDLAGNTGRDQRHVLIDRTPPRIVLVGPLPTLVATTTLQIEGDLDDPQASLKLNGLPLVLDPMGHFIARLPLVEGPNSIALVALDAAGNESRLDAVTTRDTLAPVVFFKTPLDGGATNAHTLLVSGQVDDLSASVMVNGQPVAFDGTGFFSLTMDLQEGPLTLQAQATDPVGNTGTASAQVTVDWSAPVILLDQPLPALISASSYVLNGHVDDPFAQFTVNGQPVALDANGAFTASVSFVEGPNAFLLQAIDAAGNLGSLQVQTIRDTTAPIIKLSAPIEALLTNTPQVQVNGQVDDLSAMVQVNGQSVTLDALGNFALTLSPAEGALTVTATATDAVGNAGSDLRHILVDRTAPRITLTRPVPGLVNLTHLDVQGVVDDPAAALTLNGQPVALSAAGAFTATVGLTEGNNVLQFVALDRAGNTSRLLVQTLRDTTAPVVQFTAPAEGFLTNAASIQVSGTVNDPAAAVTVNGQTTTLDATGHFSLTLSPAEGPLTLTATAIDAAGNSGSDLRHLTIDRTPPRITLSQPVPDLVNLTQVGLRGLVDDTASVLTVNGIQVVLDATGTFATTMNLAEGTNAIVLQAKDQAGNVGTLQVSTIRDTTAPVVTLDSPVEGFITNQHSLVVKGHVDDPTARVLIGGQQAVLDGAGAFELSLNPSEGSQLIVVLATDKAGNTGHATRGITLDWTPPILTWIDPTPAEGSLATQASIPVAASVSESSVVTLNGQSIALQPSAFGAPAGSAPFLTKTSYAAQEGPLTLVLQAVDRAGNTTTLQRRLDVGLIAPRVVVESPLDGFTSTQSSSALVGHIESSDFAKPLQLTLGGTPVSLGSDGRFNLPVSLQEGTNPFTLEATNRFGLKGRASLTLKRFTTPFGVELTFPLDGMAVPNRTIDVRGRVYRENTVVQVNGILAAVDPTTLSFVATGVPLVDGANILTAQASDLVGNHGSASVHVVCAPAVGDAKAAYRWDLPVGGSTSHVRTVHVSGQATLPAVSSVIINGQAMSLSGDGASGRFEGDLRLEQKDRNTLLLEARTMAGESFTERRDISYVPDLPRIRLMVPDSARPGDSVPVQVVPEPGTLLDHADLTWNGRLLGQVLSPFAPVQATVPSDALPGSQIQVEALGVDANGEQITARAYVSVYGAGALVVEAYNDRTGLPMKDGGTAAVEGGESHDLDTSGRAALATALPQNWVKVSRSGYVSVWRSASLKVGGVEAVVDARLTPLAAAQPLDIAGGDLPFANGALTLSVPAQALSAPAQLSATALSGQGLPALLPMGWSAVSAWWLDLQGSDLKQPAAANLVLPAAPALPSDQRLAWVRWDASLHQWVTVAAGLATTDLSALAVPAPGGYALVIPDPGATAPPSPVVQSPLPAYEGSAWRDGLAASTTATPVILPTVDAIQGARVSAPFHLDFQDGAPLPSGVLIQSDVLESYTLLDQSLIEPESFTEDAVASRWVLDVNKDGKPALASAGNGLSLSLPVRMSRAFTADQLVEGRILLAFYHDGIQLAETGSVLLGAGGGTVAKDGVSVDFLSGALGASTLVRLSVDPDPVAQWPELAGQGTLAKSFQLDVVGTLLQGLQVSVADLGTVPDGISPILVQRRVVQGQRVALAVGALQSQGGVWRLSLPTESNPIMDGGSFAIVLPAQPWAWVTGTALIPSNVAQAITKRLGAAKAKLMPAIKQRLAGDAGSDATVADAVIGANYLQAVSGPGGLFAVPSFPSPTGTVTLNGQRWDLGVSGSLAATVPSSGNALRLASVPFRVTGVLPMEGAEAGPGEVLQVLMSTAADPTYLDGVRLYVDAAAQSMTSGNSLRASVPVPARAAKKPYRGNSANTPNPTKAKAPVARSSKRDTRKSRPASKQALALQAVTDLVELPLRRNLSQDGRTLLLTPESPLPTGTSLRLQVEGLRSISGESAPSLTRRFHTAAVPPESGVDLSRLRLSYPTDAFDVTVTVPQGAVPAWSIVSVEAPDMGSEGQGVMPPAGDLGFQIKANLGERLNVTVQLRDGRVVRGTLSRYVADDGRTTLGPDGGRVDGPNGLAIVVPNGALTVPVELAVDALTAPAAPADGALQAGEKFVPALRIRANTPLTFLKPPVVELPAAAVPQGLTIQSDPNAYFGNGPLAVFRKNTRVLPDGSQDESYVLMDTAQLGSDGQKVSSLGGLRLPDAQLGTVIQAAGFQMPKPAPSISKPAVTQKAPTARMQSLAADTSYSYMDIYLWGFPVAASGSPEPETVYHSGTVYRNWNGSGRCNGIASADCYGQLSQAEVYRYSGTTGIDVARQGRLSRGRMLAVTDDQGRYLSVGGPMASTIPGQTWIALYAVDPRTGETSIDTGAVYPPDKGFPWTAQEHSLLITSIAGNPFDPKLTAPRIRAAMVDAQGNARSIFAVGESATLRIFTEVGSQPVVQGKVSGAITQDFGGLPVTLPVSFAQDGPWHVDVNGWTAMPMLGHSALDLLITPAGQLGPDLPGRPTLISKEPQDGDAEVDPTVIIKLTFSEPVHPDPSQFIVMVNGQLLTSFKLLSAGREVTPDQPAQEIWLVPDQRLSLGATVQVALGGIQDFDATPMTMDPILPWTFTIRGADEVGSLIGVGAFSDMVVHQGQIYAVEKIGDSVNDGFDIAGEPISGIRVIDASDPSQPKQGLLFGAHGSWFPTRSTYNATELEPFYKHEIRGIRVALGVGIDGQIRDLLLVHSRPRQESELYSWSSDGQNEYRSRHNTLWVFDITGDAASKGPLGEPKLLMSTSLGTQSENWGKGLGSAGGVLGTVRLRGGMTLWDANAWRSSFRSDAQLLGISEDNLARRSRTDKGYFPDPSSVVASNGFYNATASVKPSVLSAVIADDANGQPIAFAAMGYSEGKLVFIDPKLNDPLAKATFTAGGPLGMDGRMQDFSASVSNEPAGLVEVIKGTYQGPSGTETSNLLFVATAAAGKGHLWVLKSAQDPNGLVSLTPLAQAEVSDRITRIAPDPLKMLVGVSTTGHGYVFDLKDLRSVSGQLIHLSSLVDFDAPGPFTLQDGLLYLAGTYDTAVAGVKTRVQGVRILNIDGTEVETLMGVPVLADASKVFAGAFYDYMAQRLGDPNPDKTPVLDPAFMYQVINRQQHNHDYPFLRHYYPDLGEMVLSATVKVSDPLKQQRLYADQSKWFMEAKGKLFIGGREIAGGLTLEAMTITNGQISSMLNSPRGPIQKIDINEKIPIATFKNAQINSPVTIHRELVYTPYRFYISRDVLSSYDQVLRTDRDGKNHIEVQFDLYEDEEHRLNNEPEGTSRLEFTIKFNSNTTLFDIARGGVWHYDPVVSGDEPGYSGRNPLVQTAMDDWAKTQILNQSDHTAFSSAVMRRLSLSPVSAPEAVADSVDGVRRQDIGAVKLQDMGLESMQSMLERSLVALRRRVFIGADGIPNNTEPMPYSERPSFLWHESHVEGGTLVSDIRGDLPGAFGYRTAHIVNAIQKLGSEYFSNSRARNLDDPSTWEHDPALTLQEFNRTVNGVPDPIDGRIAPVIDQRFRLRGEFNPDNTLVQYWVAYPRLRDQGNSSNGLYAINTVLTRDLVLGPTDPNNPDDVKDRAGLNTWLSQVNTLPEKRYWASSDATRVEALFNGPSSDELPTLIRSSQAIFRADRNQFGFTTGQWFNEGFGIMQLALHEFWGRYFDRASTGYDPVSSSPHVLIIGRPLNGDDPGLKQDIHSFLLKHYKAPRVDVWVNGVLTLHVQMEAAVRGLQEKLDLVERVTPSADFATHVPVIGVYNQTTVNYDGSRSFAEADPFEYKDILSNQEDTTFPTRPTHNPDSLRLITTLRTVVDVLWDPAFEQDFLAAWEQEAFASKDALRELGMQQLTKIRQHLTLQAHSQGARLSAVAKTRLGSIQPSQVLGQAAAAPIDVVSQYDYVDYGNGAGMPLWWHRPSYRSHVHHINRFDFIPASTGVTPLWINNNTSLVDLGYLSMNTDLQNLGFLMMPNPIYASDNQWVNVGNNLATLPVSPQVRDALFGYYYGTVVNLMENHVFIVHGSTCDHCNADNHDVINAYLCNVAKDQDDALSKASVVLPPWYKTTAGIPAYWDGQPVCEQGDCGGVNSTTPPADGAKLMGDLEVTVDGLPLQETDANIEVLDNSPAFDHRVALLTQGQVVHPLNPGWYLIRTHPVSWNGQIYQPTAPEISLQIEGGHRATLQVTYAAH